MGEYVGQGRRIGELLVSDAAVEGAERVQRVGEPRLDEERDRTCDSVLGRVVDRVGNPDDLLGLGIAGFTGDLEVNQNQQSGDLGSFLGWGQRKGPC